LSFHRTNLAKRLTLPIATLDDDLMKATIAEGGAVLCRSFHLSSHAAKRCVSQIPAPTTTPCPKAGGNRCKASAEAAAHLAFVPEWARSGPGQPPDLPGCRVRLPRPRLPPRARRMGPSAPRREPPLC